MAGEGTIIPISTKPGVQRDGTMFDSDAYVDAVWTRWVAGRPRKIGGYRQMTDDYSGPIRQLYLRSIGEQFAIFAGSSSKLEVGYFSKSGFGSGVSDITPSGFAADENNMWQMDGMFDPTGANAPLLFAIATPSLGNTGIETNGIIYYGQVGSLSAFAALTDAPEVSGGLVVLHPYLFAYGNNGYVAWSDAGNPTVWPGSATPGDAGSANITENKIIRGLAFTGGVSASPGGLFWSLDKLHRASYVGGTEIFRFDHIGDASLIGADAVVEFNGLYYWVEHDRFCMYNGTIMEIPNTMNMDFFFENINNNQHQKVIGFKINRYGEIGWMFCVGDATEPNWAIIYNTRQEIWYDTPLPEGGRSAVINTSVFQYPIWAGIPRPSETNYPLWQHELGYDKIVGSRTEAIRSYFETSMISLASEGLLQQGWSGKDENTLVFRLEPDFIGSGDMNVKVIARSTPQGEDTSFISKNFSMETDFIDFGQYDERIWRLGFESNSQGGTYKMGHPLIHVKQGGGRINR